MLPFRLSFDAPAYLLLLLLVPMIWLWSFRSLAGLGRIRRLVAIGLRSALLILIALALAEVKFVRTSDRLTVIYLLDQSRSIPAEQRRAMVDYAKAEVAAHRNREREDRAGVIVFGGDAKPEIPPFDDELAIVGQLESTVDADHTNLAAAMKMAHAMFSDDAAKRIVIISDGNENQGEALSQAEAMAEAGVSIYVVPVRYSARAEVAVEKVTIPSNVNRGQPFDLRVVLNNAAPQDAGPTKGKLMISREVRGQREDLHSQEITLEPGKSVFRFEQEIKTPDFYSYEARFVPDDAAQNDVLENNVASAHTHVRGQGQILMIENAEATGQDENAFLIERLREGDMEVTRQPSNQLFTSLAELQPFDAVILADTPREYFSDSQIQMLVSNTQQMGAGMIMLGGENSFGAGGWTNTELEKAMPVDFQIKNSKVQAVGALALMMHASEMPEGNYWQKVVAKKSIEALSPQDYCGLIRYASRGDEWLWDGGIQKVSGKRQKMLALLDQMQPGDMPDFEPAMKMALAAFAGLPAEVAVKHMIIISDGDPTPCSNSVLQALRNQKVTVTTVAIGSHGMLGNSEMQRIANATGGKYHVVTNANTLPKIYQKEVRAIAKPLIYEPGQAFRPQMRYPHLITKDLDGPLPPLTGFVVTQKKDSHLSEVLMTAAVTDLEERNSTILAAWPYGAGKTVAFTTDTGKRWATQWTAWENYDKLFVNMVRWAMRPAGDAGNFSVVTDVQDGKVRLVVTALDKEDEFINFLDMAGSVVGPEMKPLDLKLQQTAPGRYVGEFNAKDAGSYFLMLNPGAGLGAIRTGVNVPYSAEFLDRETNEELLETIAALQPRGGEPGKVIDSPTGIADPEPLLAVNTFEHNLPKATSRQDAWYLLIWFGGLLFFFDVCTRRVAFSMAWLPPMAARLRDRVLGRQEVPAESELLDRLRSRKAEVTEQLEQRRAATRFEPSPDAALDTSEAERELAAEAPKSRVRERVGGAAIAPGKTEEETYTSRLLKAKKKVWEEREEK